MTAVPAALGVNVTEHVPAARVQLAALNVPARPLATNPTEPAGVLEPTPLVSATVAVHVEAWLIATVPGLHTIVVDVVRRVTVSANVPELPVCVSLGVYVPVIVCEPAALGVKLTEHEAVVALTVVSVHGLGVLKVPPVLLNKTVPAGVVGVPEVSLTKAVHEDAWFTATGLAQESVVVVGLDTALVTV
jgi:hypothetical protein